MKKLMLIFMLAVPFTMFGQSDTISVTFEARELSYVYVATGKLPAEAVDGTRAKIVNAVNGEFPTEGNVTLNISRDDVLVIASSLGRLPIIEALPLWIKMSSLVNDKWEQVKQIIFEGAN